MIDNVIILSVEAIVISRFEELEPVAFKREETGEVGNLVCCQSIPTDGLECDVHPVFFKFLVFDEGLDAHEFSL